MSLGIDNVKFPAKLSLTEKELSTMYMLAEQRGAHKSEWGQRFVPSTNTDSNTQVSVNAHFMGLCGEYAVARMTKGFFDPMPRFLGDQDKSDITVGRRGARIAVKTTQYREPILKLTNMKEISDASHLALCLFESPNIWVYWIKEKHHFINEHYKRDFGYGTRFCLAA
jgi:hypothetical protein